MGNSDLEYRMACTEVLEVLKHMPKKEASKIPTDVIKTMERYKRYDYKFHYDIKKTLKEQNISKTAREILSTFYRDYLVDDKIRKLILAKEKFDKKQNA